MGVRWALEEVGEPYDVQLMSFAALKEPVYRALQPFGQIPAFQQDGLTVFESGAIILHVAQRHPGLLPEDADARARAISWIFAALSTIEPPIVERSAAILTERNEPWYEARLPLLENRIRRRLADLARRLGDAEWLEGAFSAGDLQMITVLRRIAGSLLLEEHPNLSAYVARGEARPAFARAFAAQLAVFTAQDR